MKKIIPAVKGTRDFYPEDMAIRSWLYNTMRQVSELFGYQEYEAPILETLDLYAAKSGEELVKEQAFVFPDRGGELITLRPELTPSLSRMVAQRQKQLLYPLRWWSFGPFWRYERPQKGRTREFFQWNVDLLGVDTPEADAEVIALVATFFKKVGLSPAEVQILFNSRKLMEEEISQLGIPTDKKTEIYNLIDRRNKMNRDEWISYARSISLSEDQIRILEELLSNKSLWMKSPELVRVLKNLDAMGVSEYVRFDPNIIRGLLYYTGTVFEAYDQTGFVTRSILGGGRYDNLLADVGGDPLPAVGFAMGDVIITLLLQKLGRIPEKIFRTKAQVMVTIFSEEMILDSLALATELRSAGINTLCYPEAEKISKQFKFADRAQIPYAIVLGPDEKQSEMVALKSLSDGNQRLIPRAELIQVLKGLL